MENNHDLLQVLTREGVLISVSVRYWRGFKKLQAEDLGLDSSKVSDRLISLGHKRLLPKEATAQLALAESRAHALLENHSFPCVAALREQTGRLCQEMLESINSCETGVHQKTLNRLVKFIDQFKQMNFVMTAIDVEWTKRVLALAETRIGKEHRNPSGTSAFLP